jgi:hypothetical protein
MHEAALAADVGSDRLSFVHAVELVRDAVPEFQMVDPRAAGAVRAAAARYRGGAPASAAAAHEPAGGEAENVEL